MCSSDLMDGAVSALLRPELGGDHERILALEREPDKIEEQGVDGADHGPMPDAYGGERMRGGVFRRVRHEGPVLPDAHNRRRRDIAKETDYVFVREC